MITNCIDYYKKLYNWEKVVFVLRENTNEDLLSLFKQETEEIDNIEKYIAIKQWQIKQKNVITYKNLDELMEKVDKLWAFKLIFLNNWEIKIGDIYSSVLTKEFIEKLRKNWKLQNMEYKKYKKLFEALNKSTSLMRMHFVNLKEKWSIFNELFHIQWAGEKNWTVLLKENNVYYPNIKKPENEIERSYILNLFEENKKFFKKNKIDLEKDDIYLITMENGNIPIWMFELKNIGWTDIKEFWTFALDKNLHWKDIFPIIFKQVLEKLNKKVIIVTPNPSIQNFLESENFKIITENDSEFKERFEKMQKDNEKDNKWRKMYLVDLK